jgi:hypothetical protein
MKNASHSRKYGTYNALMLALRKCKVTSFGKVSTFLLESFLENNGRILASQVVARGICEDGKFRDWRKDLLEKGWLIWSESQDDKGQYFAGKRLVPYLNKEKLRSKEIVTKDEVLSKHDAATKAELEEINEKLNARLEKTDDRLSKIEASMQEVYKKLNLGEPDPPFYKKLQELVIPKEKRN